MRRTKINQSKLSNGGGSKYLFETPDGAMSHTEFLQGLRDDPSFRMVFTQTLRDSPYAAFRWETPPVTVESISEPFECVLLDAPGLARSADESAFAEHFDRAGSDGVIAFENLGGDAALVVPCPQDPIADYCHLASFLREAPALQINELWQCVGQEALNRLSDERLWLSTAGGGVSWLHVRLDSRPKYYGHAPYRNG